MKIGYFEGERLCVYNEGGDGESYEKAVGTVAGRSSGSNSLKYEREEHLFSLC